jgi:predicted Zn-dependent protease
MDKLSEVSKMAYAAEKKASEALYQIEGHEEICAERYKNITDRMASIPKIYESINSLQKTANLAIGMSLGFTGVSTILGMAFLIMRLIGKN